MLTSRPSAWTASIRHERTARPSSTTVHAPQTPCSQPRWVPVSPQLLAQEVGEREADRFDLLACSVLPLTVTVMVRLSVMVSL